MSQPASAQLVHLGLETIEDGVLRLPGGRYRAVLEVGSINFALQRAREREAIVAGFAAFLNGLTFPIQILVRSLPLDLTPYLEELEQQALADELAGEGVLADLIADYVVFLRRLVRNRTLLERRFFVVVPAQGEPGPSRWLSLFRRRPATFAADSARQQLTYRCQEIERELGRCGLPARRLGSLDLAQLLYACWCADLARTQRLQRELRDYTAPVVQAGRAPERTS